MNRLILTSIIILILATTAGAEVQLPKDKLSEQDYNTLSRLNENTEVEVVVRIQKTENRRQIIEELQEAGVKIIATVGDEVIIRTAVGRLNKIASSDGIILIEKEGKEPKGRRARALSKPTTPSIIQAKVVCDNPSTDYQSQIQDAGAKIIKTEGNKLEVEVVGYEILNEIGHLNYVMRIDDIKEISAFDINTKLAEEDKWILELADNEVVEVILIPAEAGLIDILKTDNVEISKEKGKEILIRCSVAKLKELARLDEVAVILAGAGK
ncbi:MAG: hypothetical protein QME42_04750 [bacterium]|nr:hypothetical protein [bacterium]